MTGQADIEVLVRRVHRLEREMRWWRVGVPIVLLSAVALLFVGQANTAPTVIEAQKFILRDPDNRVRAVLGTEFPGSRATGLTAPDVGQYGLHFYDSDGAYRAGLSEFGDATASWQLQLQAKGTPSAAHLLVADGLAALTLNAIEQTREVTDKESAEWAKRFNAAKTPEEREKLLIGRKMDGVNAALSAFPKGTSSLSLKHGLGGGLDFYLLRRQSSVYLMDENGTTRATLGHAKIERPTTGVIEERPVSSLLLFDKEVKEVWKAP